MSKGKPEDQARTKAIESEKKKARKVELLACPLCGNKGSWAIAVEVGQIACMGVELGKPPEKLPPEFCTYRGQMFQSGGRIDVR